MTSSIITGEFCGMRRDIGHFDRDADTSRTMAGGARHVQRVQPAELASREHHDARAERHRADGAPANGWRAIVSESLPPSSAAALAASAGHPRPGYCALASRRDGPGARGGPGLWRRERGPKNWAAPVVAARPPGWAATAAPSTPRVAGPRWCAALRRDPLQVGHIGLRLGLGGRRVVDDLALVGGDRVDRVEQKRRIIHRQPPQHGRHPLPADLGPLDVVDVQAALEDTAADELHRVGEVRQRQQPGGGALGGVIDVVEVRQAVRSDMQNLLDVVALVGEQLGELRQLVDLADQRVLLSCRNPRTSDNA